MGFKESRIENTSDVEESIRQMLGLLFGRDVEEEEIERFSRDGEEEVDGKELSVKEKIDMIFNNELDKLIAGDIVLENANELETLLQCYHGWTQLEK